uniref:14-3-3-like protein n=1 Tax=Tanacetum cinerariifolium TaxID=118510 RepID=A0A6L2M3E4_TANCI|nr:14-3-3-like protein [Tanacetum cinerariifolium]
MSAFQGNQGVHGVHDEKRVWFEVELQVAQGNHKTEDFRVSNDDAAVAQRRLEDEQLKEMTNTDRLVKEQEKVHLSKKVRTNIMVTGVHGQEGVDVLPTVHSFHQLVLGGALLSLFISKSNEVHQGIATPDSLQTFNVFHLSTKWYLFQLTNMVEAVTFITKLGVELTAEERKLLSFGYKKVLDQKKVAWRIMSVIKSKEEANGDMRYVALVKQYLKRVEDELTTKCNEILLTTDDYLLPFSKTPKASLLYLKL